MIEAERNSAPGGERQDVLDIELDDELRRKAHRSMAGQAAAGVVLYPLLCLVFGHAAALTERQPVLFILILGTVVLTSALRGFLVLRFDPLYRRSPERWERLHTTSVLASALVWTAISGWAFLEHGLTGVTSFGLLASAILCNMALVVYAPSLLLVRRFLTVVLAPHLAVFLVIGDDARRLIAPLTVVYGLYLWNAASRLHRNYWRARSDARLLALRAAELEEALAARKRAEEELLRHRRHLEELVQERTRSLEQAVAELEVKNAELEIKNAEMERFTYTISHDLKSPLITIRGFLGLLKRDVAAGDRERMESDMERIYTAAGRMARLLDELLELSRIGRIVNDPRQVSLGELAHEVVELLAGPIAEHQVEVEVAPDLPVVFGDRPRLLEVFQNLVENAVRFDGGQPRPRIEIGMRREEGEAVLYVRDNGLGIDPRYHEKVFGLFERLDHGVDGTGIGLALVRRIVEVHGGRIWVESEGEGRGSCFCFTLGEGGPEAAVL